MHSKMKKWKFDILPLQYHKYLLIYIFLGAVRRGLQPDPRRPCEESDSVLGLGELAQLTVNNDAEAAYDVSLITFFSL